MTAHGPRRVRKAALLLTALSVAIAACGAPPSEQAAGKSGEDASAAEETYARFNAMTGQEREDALAEAAKKEGALTIYGTPTATKPVAQAFEKKYGIKVEVATGTDDLLRKLQQEAKAGRVASADVYESVAVNVALADKNGLLGHYESEARNELPEQGRGENWTSVSLKVYATAYNTDLVKADELPKNVLDFAKPRWKGKLALVTEDFDWYMALYDYHRGKGMSGDEIDKAFAGMIRNSSSFAPRSSQQMELLEAGQFGVSLNNHVAAVGVAQSRKSPVAWRGEPTVEPLVKAYLGSGLIRNAKHPAAAMLYLDFALSEEGTAALQGAHQVPNLVGSDDPLKDVETIDVDTHKLAENIDEWSSRFEKLIRSNR